MVAIPYTLASALEVVVHAVSGVVILGGLFIPAGIISICSEDASLKKISQYCNVEKGLKHLIRAVIIAIQTPFVFLSTLWNGARAILCWKLPSSLLESYYSQLDADFPGYVPQRFVDQVIKHCKDLESLSLESMNLTQLPGLDHLKKLSTIRIKGHCLEIEGLWAKGNR